MAIKNRPQFMKEPDRFISYAKEAFTSQLSLSASKLAKSAGAQVEQATSKRMVATVKTLGNRGVIDLKPFMRNAKNVRVGKNGKWYVVIPIRVTRRNLRLANRNDDMYNRMRKAAADIEAGQSGTVNINGIFSGRQTQTLASLTPDTATDNITAQKSQSGKRTSYVAYRTVSQNSKPQSWVMNRGNVTEDNTSNSLRKGIDTMIRKRLKSMGGS